MSDLLRDIELIENQPSESCDYKTTAENALPSQRKLYIESYGCQMNFSDSEIVASILAKEGFGTTSSPEGADLILLNTCAIRDKAEQTVRNRLRQFQNLKKNNPELTIGLLGCMAERLKTNLLEEEKIVDLVAGPDSYRDLPNLVATVDQGHKAINVILSREETYADIAPVRLNSNGVTAFISIMRGCDNVCSFCVVPMTRGRERSRDPESIVREAQELFENGYREVTLLGQNVDSYRWSRDEKLRGKALVQAKYDEKVVNFAQLLVRVAQVSPLLRVRFSTSHPKDMTDDVLEAMREYPNICSYIHLPVQSGSDSVLERMNRSYTRQWYLERIAAIRQIVGHRCGISSDMIAGFCGETEEDHAQTISLMEAVKYDFAYMFYYSERPGTPAAKRYTDDVPLETKKRRLNEIIALQNQHSLIRNQQDIGQVYEVLIEGTSKRSSEFLQGRNPANKVVIFPKQGKIKGQYVNVLIESCSAATLHGKIVES
jgi:tRNA-2-methylthio-N6-dimethylallyladenosine synthase